MALFDMLSKRVGERARGLAEAMLDRAERAYGAIPGSRVRREGGSVTVEAAGLRRRRLSDVRIRFLSWNLK